MALQTSAEAPPQASASDAPVDKAPADTKQHESLLALARDRFRMVCEFESDLRQQQRIDKEFINGQQWNETELRSRTHKKRPSSERQ